MSRTVALMPGGSPWPWEILGHLPHGTASVEIPAAWWVEWSKDYYEHGGRGSSIAGATSNVGVVRLVWR